MMASELGRPAGDRPVKRANGVDYSIFDQIVSRRESGSVKHCSWHRFGKPEGLIPLWVADMDFYPPPEVAEALKREADSTVYGYTYAYPEYFNALLNWFHTRHGWEAREEWCFTIPAVMFGVTAAILALSQEGEGVVIQQPVYHPFKDVIVANRRTLVVNELVQDCDGRYGVNWEDFEEKIARKDVKIFLLCSPHNPVARVWEEGELRRMGEICLRHGVKVISDEIHADFALWGAQHVMFPTLGDEFSDNCVLCTAPSKTFNLMGLQSANIWASNATIRQGIIDECMRFCWYGISVPALSATMVAYRFGAGWLDELRTYLEDNVRYVSERLATMQSGIRVTPQEGTYLMWLDCRAWGWKNDEIDTFFTHKAGLWLNNGAEFGLGGDGFMRLNVASPRNVLEKAMNQLELALNKR